MLTFPSRVIHLVGYDIPSGYPLSGYSKYTLWLFNIAMGNGPFIDGLPIKNGDFPWLC